MTTITPEFDHDKLENEIREFLIDHKFCKQSVTEINSFNLLGNQENELVHFIANLTLETKTTDVVAIFSTVFKKIIYLECM